MDASDEDIELDRILAVLENPIRRRILQKLSREMNYPLQLSKELNVSQQAIMKHLKVLEDNDFVVSYDERSDKGGAPRKVYIPRKRYCVRIDIGPNTYHEEFYSFKEYNVKKKETEALTRKSDTTVQFGGRVTGEMKSDIEGVLPAFTDPALENYRIRLEKAINTDNDEEKLKALKDLITHLNLEIQKMETKRKRMPAIRERAFEDVNQTISNLYKDHLEKEILSLFVKNDISDLETISNLLDVRRIYIEEFLKQILNRYR